jgi:hypothetical protein
MSCLDSVAHVSGNLLHGRYEILAGGPEHSTNDSVIVRATDHGVVREYHDIFLSYSHGGNEVHSKPYRTCMIQVFRQLAIPFQEHHQILICGDDEGTEGITMDDFVCSCVAAFGRTRQVFLKFMKSKVKKTSIHMIYLSLIPV